MSQNNIDSLAQLAMLTALMQRAHPGAILAMGAALKQDPSLYQHGEDLFMAEYGVKESDTMEPALPKPESRRANP